MERVKLGIKRIEIIELLKDFYIIKTNAERIFYVGTPIFIGILYLMVCKFVDPKTGFMLDKFLKDFINAQITVIALFVSFSMAYLTILITSNSENVTLLKCKTSSKYELNKKPVFLFQVLLVDITYTIIIEIFLLVFSFLQKFLIVISGIFALKVYLLVNIVLFVHIILLLLRNVKNIYYSFWNPK